MDVQEEEEQGKSKVTITLLGGVFPEIEFLHKISSEVVCGKIYIYPSRGENYIYHSTSSELLEEKLYGGLYLI